MSCKFFGHERPGTYDHNASLGSSSFTRVETACTATRCGISLTVVQQSGRIVTLYFYAALEIDVCVTQFWSSSLIYKLRCRTLL